MEVLLSLLGPHASLAPSPRPPDVVFVPVGGGGLMAGIAALLKAVHPAVHVVGCQPRASAVMAHSVRAGRVLDLPSDPTLSDATAGAWWGKGPCGKQDDQQDEGHSPRHHLWQANDAHHRVLCVSTVRLLHARRD